LLFSSAHAQEVQSVTICNDPAPSTPATDKGNQTEDFFTYLITAKNSNASKFLSKFNKALGDVMN